jgi:protease I
VAILVENGFEQVELLEPQKALDQAGAETRIVSPKSEHVRGWNFTDWGDEFPVDGTLVSSRKPDDIPALDRAMIELFSRTREHARHTT